MASTLTTMHSTVLSAMPGTGKSSNPFCGLIFVSAQLVRQGSREDIRSYLEAESLFNMAIASCTVVINCAGKIMVEFFSVAISAIVCSVRS